MVGRGAWVHHYTILCHLTFSYFENSCPWRSSRFWYSSQAGPGACFAKMPRLLATAIITCLAGIACQNIPAFLTLISAIIGGWQWYHPPGQVRQAGNGLSHNASTHCHMSESASDTNTGIVFWTLKPFTLQ